MKWKLKKCRADYEELATSACEMWDVYQREFEIFNTTYNANELSVPLSNPLRQALQSFYIGSEQEDNFGNVRDETTSSDEQVNNGRNDESDEEDDSLIENSELGNLRRHLDEVNQNNNKNL